MCGTQEPMGSGVPGGTHPTFKNMGSGGFRVPGKLGRSGFRWVPGSRSEPKKWVPGGSGFQVGTQKVGSDGFRVPGRNPKSGFRGVPGRNPEKRVPGKLGQNEFDHNIEERHFESLIDDLEKHSPQNSKHINLKGSG